MAFLENTGLERLWGHIVHRLSLKADKEDLKALSKTVDELPQSDWNQNDENANDYIKNKPFGEEIVWFTYAESQTITIDKGSASFKTADQWPKVGDKYIVVFDGDEYEGFVWEDDDACYRYDFTTKDGIEVEVLDYYLYADGLDGEHTLEIRCGGTTITKLPDRFLPDDLVRTGNHINNIIASRAPVKSVNNQTGYVSISAANIGAVPTTRKINNKKLDADISLTAAEVGALSKSDAVGSGYLILNTDSFSMSEKTSGLNAFVAGSNNIASHRSMSVIGEYNANGRMCVEVVGEPQTSRISKNNYLYQLIGVKFIEDPVRVDTNGNINYFFKADSITHRIFNPEPGMAITQANTLYPASYREIISIDSEDSNYWYTTEREHTGQCIVDDRQKYVHIVGNGTDNSNRSNAHTLDWDGNAWFAGDVYVGSTSGTNMDEGSKKLATTPDWDICDKNDASYIKNKTHYTEIQTLNFQEEFEIEWQGNNQFRNASDKIFDCIVDHPDDYTLTFVSYEGTELVGVVGIGFNVNGNMSNFTVAVNGVTYEANVGITKNSDGTAYLHVQHLSGSLGTDFNNNNRYTCILRITGLYDEEIIHQLDEKYIPDTIATTESIATQISQALGDVDLSNIYSKTEVDNAITAATNNVQPKDLVATITSEFKDGSLVQSCDVSSADLWAAHEAGRNVVFDINGYGLINAEFMITASQSDSEIKQVRALLFTSTSTGQLYIVNEDDTVTVTHVTYIISANVKQETGTDRKNPMSQKAVTSALANKKDKDFIVQISGNETDGYVADKTFDEIIEAANNGATLYAITSSMVKYEFNRASDTNAWFNSYTPNTMTYQTITIKSDNTVSLTSKNIAATQYIYGGVKAAAKTDTDTVEAKIGTDGKLYVPTYPKTETWTFTLEDGSTVTKAVCVG